MKTNPQKGTSLVESMFAILIITIVALAGAAFIFFGSSRVNLERNKRVALEMANTRLEELHVSGYSSIEPPDDTQAYFIERQGGSWAIYAGDPGETARTRSVGRTDQEGARRSGDPR